MRSPSKLFLLAIIKNEFILPLFSTQCELSRRIEALYEVRYYPIKLSDSDPPRMDESDQPLLRLNCPDLTRPDLTDPDLT